MTRVQETERLLIDKWCQLFRGRGWQVYLYLPHVVLCRGRHRLFRSNQEQDQNIYFQVDDFAMAPGHLLRPGKFLRRTFSFYFIGRLCWFRIQNPGQIIFIEIPEERQEVKDICSSDIDEKNLDLKHESIRK